MASMLRTAFAAFGALALAACSATSPAGERSAATAAAPAPTSGAPSTGVAVVVPSGPTDPRVAASVQAYVSTGSRSDTGLALLDAIEASHDPRLVAYLIDVLRVGPDSRLEERALEILGPLTGLGDVGPQPAAYLAGGRWLLQHRLDPGPEYVAFKQEIYRAVDPAFAPLFGRVSDRVIVAQLQWGGVPFAGIRELNAPVRRTIDQLGWRDRVRPEELVLGAVVNDASVGYPVRILGRHELANDTVGGVPVALAYCTLCRSALLFDRRIDGQVLEFQTSGLLIDSNKVMVDRQTGSLWRQLSGEAIGGPLTGRKLEILPIETTTWSAWTAAEPATEILELPDPWLVNSPDGPILASYLYSPDAVQPAYYASDALWFPTLGTPGPLRPKDEVIGIAIDGAALAVELGALRQNGPVVLPLGAATVVVVAQPGGAAAYDGTGLGLAAGTRPDVGATPIGADQPAELADGRRLRRLASTQSFWFAWYANHPATTWWPGG